MRRELQIALLLLMCVPVHAQLSMKLHKTTRMAKSVLLKTSVRADRQGVCPSRSLVYYAYDSSGKPDTLTYDRFGNVTNRVHGNMRDFREFDALTGTVLLNSIAYNRDNERAPWVESNVELRTTLNGQGIRTEMLSSDYNEIGLNEKGYVISYDDSENEHETDRGANIWDGDRLKSVTSEFSIIEDGKKYEERIIMDNIDVVYENKPFNRYEIDYSEYLTNLSKSGIAYNATGTYSEGSDAVPQNLSISSQVSEDKKIITMEYRFGEVSRNEKLTYTDDNGSYSYEITFPGEESLEINTVNCNEYGDVTNENYKEVEGEKEYIRNYRYVWTYDEGKPVKLETYDTYDGEDEELSRTEYFTAWHDGTVIRAIRNDIKGEILGATLFSLSGAPVKILSAEEVSGTIELPGGIYLLHIRTTEGVVIKKLMK